MSESMIERVAKAIFFQGGEQDEVMWKHMQSHLRDMACQQARAAIEAMREPTQAMTNAGENDGGHSYYRWQAMIRAAVLSPTPEETVG